MNTTEQHETWEWFPDWNLNRRWRRRLHWMRLRLQWTLARLAKTARHILATPELVRITAPGARPEREHEWRNNQSWPTNGGGLL